MYRLHAGESYFVVFKSLSRVFYSCTYSKERKTHVFFFEKGDSVRSSGKWYKIKQYASYMLFISLYMLLYLTVLALRISLSPSR